MTTTARLTTCDLRALCIKHNWFTHGTNEQYAKLFYANDMKAPIDELVTIIWLCSDDKWCRRDIKHELMEAISKIGE